MSATPQVAADTDTAGTETDAYPAGTVLRLEGSYQAEQSSALRLRLVAAVEGAAGDLYLDAHGVTAFTDEALATLTAARSRAKVHRTRIAVLDDGDGVVAHGLRRTGRHFRFPIYADAATADQALATERDALDSRTLRAAQGADRAGA